MPRLTRLSDLEPRLPRVPSRVLTEHPFALLGAANTTTEFGPRWLVTVAFVTTYPAGLDTMDDITGELRPNRYVALLGRAESRDRLTRHFTDGGGPLGPVILRETRTTTGQRFWELTDWEGPTDPTLMAAAGLADDDQAATDRPLTDAF